jgi:CRISPR-associated protein Cmr3
MGADVWGSGIFPPYPSVIYGFLRGLYFSENINEITKAGESNDPTKNLTIADYRLKNASDFIFPAPLDLVKPKRGKDGELVPLELGKLSIISSCKTSEILISKEESDNDGNYWFGGAALNRYLKGVQNPKFTCFKLVPDTAVTEPKIGIGRNDSTHTAGDSMIYRAGMVRLKDISITAKFSFAANIDLLKLEGITKIGGEGKAVSYEIKSVEEKEQIELPPLNCNNGKCRFKIYLSTPAVFKNGWIPQWLDVNSLKGKPNGLSSELHLITAAIGKPVFIGGWDIKKGPKPMVKAVPAGSVYYFEIDKCDDSKIKAIIEKFHGKPICDDEYYCNRGFGIAYLGGVK